MVEPAAPTFSIGDDPRVDISAAAGRVLLREILPPEVTCVRADASLETAANLLVERGLRCLPVVDVDGRLIGIVSKSDILRDHIAGDELPARERLERGFHLETVSARIISDIMTPCVHALPGDAPVAFAISLLALESLYEVPVVGKDGRVLGVATALDILRWLAARMGYDLARGTALKSKPEQE
jgi:CBS domain-containing membrane protein